LECLVRRLSADQLLSSKLVFKGGYVCSRVYSSPRYTTDLDLTLKGLSVDNFITRLNSAITQSEISDGAWFKYESEQKVVAQGEYGGIRIVTRGCLGEPPDQISKLQVFHLDVGIDDSIEPPATKLETPSIALNTAFSWTVYAVETVVSDKLHTMIVRGDANSRSRDLFDIHLLLQDCQPGTLKTSLKATFLNRKDDLPESVWKVIESLNMTVMQRGWNNVQKISGTELKFDDVVKSVIDLLRTMGI